MEYRRGKWLLEDGRQIALITPEELPTLPDGTVLICIDGTSATLGQDEIDDDTRFGFLAYGIPEPADA